MRDVNAFDTLSHDTHEMNTPDELQPALPAATIKAPPMLHG
jgi:hypothetical protein